MNFAVPFLIALLSIVIGLLRYITRNFKYWKGKNIPYIKPIPLFGNVLKMATEKLSMGCFLHKLYQETDTSVFGFFVFDQPFLLIRNPDLIKSILIKDFEYFCDRSVTENHRDDKIGSSMLFILKNPTWKKLRVKLTPTFTSGKIKTMLPLMKEVGEELIKCISNSPGTPKTIEVQELCKNYTVDVISSCAFGMNSHSIENEDSVFGTVAKRAFSTKFSRSVQMASYFFAPSLVKIFRMKMLEPVAGGIMKKVIMNAVSERETFHTTRGDLIDSMIQIRKEQSDFNFLSDDDHLTAQAAIYFAAGFETSAITISFTLYELSLNLSIQNRLREEILATVRQHGSASYEAIQSMTYLDMVVRETLRKYPALPFLDRRCNRDYPVPGTDIVIEKGIPIYISLLGLHRDPDYFPDPDVFDPERFSADNKDSIPAVCYIPFGEGPRGCPGSRFGLLSSKSAIVRILTEFQVEPSEDTPVPIVFESNHVTLFAKGSLNLNFRPILSTSG